MSVDCGQNKTRNKQDNAYMACAPVIGNPLGCGPLAVNGWVGGMRLDFGSPTKIVSVAKITQQRVLSKDRIAKIT